MQWSVAVTVGPNFVAAFMNRADELRTPLSLPPENEKCGKHTMLVEQVKHAARIGEDARFTVVPSMTINYFCEGTDLKPILNIHAERMKLSVLEAHADDKIQVLHAA